MQYLGLIVNGIMYRENALLATYDYNWIKQPPAEGKDVFGPITELVCSIGAVVFDVVIFVVVFFCFWYWKKKK